MTDEWNELPIHRGMDNTPFVEYALQVTDTVVWNWNLKDENITIYPPSQNLLDEPKDIDGFLEQVHPEDQDGIMEALEKTINEDRPFTGEFRLADDENVWIASQGKIEYDSSGEPEHLVGIGQDVSERKQRNLKLQRLGEYIAETEHISEIGGWELEIETRDLHWTKGTKRIHDVSLEYEPTVEEAVEFYHPDDQSTLEKALQRCIEHGEQFDEEYRLTTAEGRERWVRSSGKRTHRGEKKVVRGVIRDITDQKIRNQRLMVLNRVLRHNIRNSLGIVMGWANRLHEDLSALKSIEGELKESTGFSVEESLNTASKIEKSSTELAEMAGKARQLSQALEDWNTNRYMAVQSHVTSVASDLRERYPDATIDVLAEDVGVKGDPDSLELVVTELIENALKHNPDPCPSVEVHVSKLENGRVGICVTDRGPGIPEMEKQVLESGVEGPLMHGHGLGLWLVNWLVAQFGGSVKIEDNDPSGTVVTLKLPAANVEA